MPKGNIMLNEKLNNNKDLNAKIEFWLNAGFTVIPAEITNGIKKPLVIYGEIRNELTQKHSLEWLKQFPNATAIATITDNGLFVLDADTPESLDALYKLESDYQVSPNLIVKTRNGEHHYFRISEDIHAIARGFNGKDFPSKIDIRTRKSFLMLPSSLRDGEVAYTIKHCAINHIDDLRVIEQRFVDAIYLHNQEPPPTVANTTTQTAEKWNGNELEVHKAKATLSYIDPDLAYEDWMRVMFGIVSKFGKTQEAINLIDEWSSLGDSYKGRDEICYKVSTIKDVGGVTFGTVRHLANQEEANLLFIDHVTCEQALGYPSFEIALDALRIDKDNGVAFDQAIYHISTSDSLTAYTQCQSLKALSGVNLAVIRSEVKKLQRKVPLTQDQIAQKVVDEFTGIKPVGEYGVIWQFNEDSGIWESSSLEILGRKIGKQYCEEQLCVRGTDYKAIAKLVYEDIEVVGFFESAPKGIQTPSGFYCIKDYQLLVLPKSHENKARFKLDYDPDEKTEPKEFVTFLKDAFGDTYEDQMHWLNIFLGFAVLGVQNERQKACLLYGAGGSGKSTFLNVLQSLIPKVYISHVSPLDMDDNYCKASLASKLLNVVPEIDKDKSIPSAAFKSIVGGDAISARVPYGELFSVVPEAANWFNSNFFPVTKDHSEAFFRRWVIFHFMNPVPSYLQDSNLLKRIIANELPSILGLAFKAVEIFLLLRSPLYLSSEHHNCMKKWKGESNSVKSWLEDEENYICERLENLVGIVRPLKKSRAYTFYSDWCKANNRRPYSSSQFIEYMAREGYLVTGYQGYSSFKKLCVSKEVPPSPLTINKVA